MGQEKIMKNTTPLHRKDGSLPAIAPCAVSPGSALDPKAPSSVEEGMEKDIHTRTPRDYQRAGKRAVICPADWGLLRHGRFSGFLKRAAALSLCFNFWPGLSRGADPAASRPPRAARSVHLWWTAPEGDLFYNEMAVTRSAEGSYFMACGWNTGYFGIQELSRGEKIVLFSVWDPTKGNNPNAVSANDRVQVLYRDPDVNVTRFGGEGTGGKSIFRYDWKIEERCRFLVRSRVEGSQTAYAGYFYLNTARKWKHLVTFRTQTGGLPLKGYYSFVEDFRRDGKSPKETRRALYGNGWVRTVNGDWVALLRATFTADRTPLLNINAGLDGQDFFLVTGGEIQNTLPLRSALSRPPAGLVLPNWEESEKKNP
jgi:Domain of unknown function (DUF3472)